MAKPEFPLNIDRRRFLPLSGIGGTASAAAAKEAAEAVCGKELVEAGHPHKLAVKVWTSSRNPPDIKLSIEPRPQRGRRQ